MRWSLATKIFLAFAVVLATFGAVAIYGVAELNSLRGQLAEVNQQLLPLARRVSELKTILEVTRKTTESIIGFEEADRQKRMLQLSLNRFRRDFAGRLRDLETRLDRVRRSSSLSIHKASERLDRHLSAVYGATKTFEQSLEQAVGEIDPDYNLRPSQQSIDKMKRQGRLLSGLIGMLERAARSLTNTAMLLIESRTNQASGVILWLSGLALLVGMAVIFLSLHALKPVDKLVKAARRISSGDFAVQVDAGAGDELGLLVTEFNRMARSLEQRQEEILRHQREMERINRQLRQSKLDLELMKLYAENIIRSMPAAIVVLDQTGSITTINPSASKLWGLDPARYTGKKLSELPEDHVLRRLSSEWKDLRSSGRFYEALEFESQSKAGGAGLLFDLRVTPLVGSDGTMQGILLVGEDVTEKVRTKQALIRSERLATIGRMSAIVAHEIRNPLSSIGLNTELLQEEIEERLAGDAGTDEIRAICANISREVDRLTEVTEEYLKFARLPKPQLVPEPLQRLLGSLLDFLEQEFREAGVRLVRKLPEDLPLIRADSGQLRQAFLNLLRNSLQSMPDGGSVSVVGEASNGVVRVRITDTGRGISPEALEHIFDPFFSTKQEGTGLGLSLTQQIITEHNGNIYCSSTPGKGTEFVVELPAYRGPAKEEDGTKA